MSCWWVRSGDEGRLNPVSVARVGQSSELPKADSQCHPISSIVFGRRISPERLGHLNLKFARENWDAFLCTLNIE
jgi:hypothetical protein